MPARWRNKNSIGISWSRAWNGCWSRQLRATVRQHMRSLQALSEGMGMRKRIFDIVLSSVILVCTLPLALIIALLVSWRMGSPILLRQQRPGLNGEAFILYKFRTMTDACDGSGRL